MTEAERQLILALALKKLTPDAFLVAFGRGQDGVQLVEDLLNEAIVSREPEDAECALLAGFVLGFTVRDLDALRLLAKADWHYRHEDVISALAGLRSPEATEELFQATQWVPEYLEYDEARALAVKAIWGLGGIDSPDARSKLEILAASENEILRGNALRQLELHR